MGGKRADFRVWLVEHAAVRESSADIYARIGRRIEASGLEPAKWLAREIRADTPPGTVSSYRAAATHYRDWMESMGLAAGAVPRVARSNRRSARFEREGLTTQELQVYHKVVTTAQVLRTRHKIRTILLLLPWTGLRIAEACSLKGGSIRAEGDAIGLHVVGKGGVERWVPLLPTARKILARYLKRRGEVDDAAWLFPSGNGEPLSPDAVRVALRAVREGMGTFGARVSPHVLRHTYASHLVDAGVDLLMVQRLLGHRSPTTTARYTHPSKAALAKQASALNRLALDMDDEGEE